MVFARISEFLRLLLLVVLVAPLSALAQDPGSTLRDAQNTQPPVAAKRTPPLTLEEMSRPELEEIAGPEFTLKQIRITGATVFTETKLAPVIDEYIGREVGQKDQSRAP
ncbi:POTRA domain-containing protein, partial [Steroidobacter sp.]|uniref:POTRA domain-containing protein n=1 Tax=Steroidobacter sp. TaxID=1978227 RepID=UPI001A63AA6D